MQNWEVWKKKYKMKNCNRSLSEKWKEEEKIAKKGSVIMCVELYMYF